MRTLAVCSGLLLLIGCAAQVDPGFIGAVRRGDVGAMQEFLKNGTDPNLRAGVNHWPAIMHAIHKGQREAVKALIAAHADVNISEEGMTPLMMAAGYGYDGIVHDLLKAGADPRRKMPDGTTALELAVVGVPDIDRFTVGACQTAAVRELLDAAPDLKFRPHGLDRTAYRLKRGGCRQVTSLLASRGAL